MVKHTQTIPRQFSDQLFECVCPFREIDAKKPSCINLILTNLLTYFQHNIVLDVGFSNCILSQLLNLK